ncbi:hypothetical protein C8F01DRAFT_1083619 [Mycena amicta]|nr:hypothetical protein C8F01DRAFT_1083619 [Mycena amicta]
MGITTSRDARNGVQCLFDYLNVLLLRARAPNSNRIHTVILAVNTVRDPYRLGTTEVLVLYGYGTAERRIRVAKPASSPQESCKAHRPRIHSVEDEWASNTESTIFYTNIPAAEHSPTPVFHPYTVRLSEYETVPYRPVGAGLTRRECLALESHQYSEAYSMKPMLPEELRFQDIMQYCSICLADKLDLSQIQ